MAHRARSAFVKLAVLASIFGLHVGVMAKVQKIAPGEYQCFFIDDGRLWGIGSNRAGQLGLGHIRSAGIAVPEQVKIPPQVQIVDVASGGYHSLAVDRAGRVWTWGSNYNGQKGDGTPPVDKPGFTKPHDDGTPYMIQTDSTGKPYTGVASVMSTLWFNVAVKKDGTCWVWGENGENGTLGNGDTTTPLINRPTQVPFPQGVKIVQVSLGRNMIGALDAQGNVWTWAGGKGPVDNRGTRDPDYSRPLKVPGLPRIRQIAISGGFNFALDTEGQLWGWGRSGTLFGMGVPEGSKQFVPTPKKLAFPEFRGKRVKQVATSWLTAHAILEDGTLWSWGDNAMGGVGNGEMLDFSQYNYSWPYKPYLLLVPRPVQVATKVRNFENVYTNSLCFYAYAMTKDGRIFSWGRNKTGILGNGIRPKGDVGKFPDSWNVPTVTEVFPLAVKRAVEVPARGE